MSALLDPISTKCQRRKVDAGDSADQSVSSNTDIAKLKVG